MKKLTALLKLLPYLCAGAVLLNASSAKAASLITFDGLGLSDYGDIPGTYGDNLPGTPNIQVEYRTFDLGTGATLYNNLDFWTTNYGDLQNIAFPVNNGSLGEISLIPDAGFSVTLNSFDLGGWFQTDQIDQTVRILDENFNILADYSPFNVEGDNGRSSFSPNLTRNGRIRIQFGPSWNTGIDNISFAQGGTATGVPTPALVPGLVGLGLSVWRKRKLDATQSQT
jgi:hypothetical protein